MVSGELSFSFDAFRVRGHLKPAPLTKLKRVWDLCQTPSWSRLLNLVVFVAKVDVADETVTDAAANSSAIARIEGLFVVVVVDFHSIVAAIGQTRIGARG